MSLAIDRLGIVAALPGEVRALARLRPRGRARLPGGARLLLSGMGAERAGQAAATLADEGVTTLMSWGTAAALAPGVDPGALILASTVRGADDREWSTDPVWRTALATALAPMHQVFEQRLTETPGLVVDAAAKRALHEATEAIACDMESAAIAAVAAERGLGFVCVRAIIDDAAMVLPPVARAAMDADGRLRPAALMGALAGRPSSVHAQLRSLKNLAVAFRAARMTLADAALIVRGEETT
ncbi:phosphorylase [Salinisphaera hydrothermalis]|uniref:phosphorylase family protein n=1 Tax=Salinisphaera hydrothermalis TaxID=563188 RepID=UPI00333FF58A